MQRQRTNRHPSACNSALKLILLASLWLASLGAWAAAGVVTHLSGTLVARLADGGSRVLSVKSSVNEGELLVTQDNTYARLKFQDGGEIVLRPNSQLEVNQYTYQAEKKEADSMGVNLLKGGMRMVTGALGKRNPERVKIETPVATIGIRGTHLGMLLCRGDCRDMPTVTGRAPQDGLHVDVAEGVIAVTNPAGQQIIAVGQFGYVQSRESPPTLVPPSQGIQVTMPQSISQNDTSGRSVGTTNQACECSVQ